MNIKIKGQPEERLVELYLTDTGYCIALKYNTPGALNMRLFDFYPSGHIERWGSCSLFPNIDQLGRPKMEVQ